MPTTTSSGSDPPAGWAVPREPVASGAGALSADDLARVFDAAPTPYMLLDPRLVIVGVNRAHCRGTSLRPQDVIGRAYADVFPARTPHPDDEGPTLRACMEQVLQTGVTTTMGPRRYALPAPDGGPGVERWWSPMVVPVLDDAGRTGLLLLRIEDITDYVHRKAAALGPSADEAALRRQVDAAEAEIFSRARELQEHNARLWAAGRRERRQVEQLEGLARAALVVGSSLSLQEVLERIVASARELLGAHQAAICYTGGTGHTGAAAAAGASGTGPLSAIALSEQTPAWWHRELPRRLPGLVAAVVHQGRVVRQTQAGLEADPGWRECLRAGPVPPVHGWLAAPITGGDASTVGVLAVSDRHEGDFDAADESVVVQLAALAAVAAGTAAVHQREHQVAETLQRSLLTSPPQPDHLQIVVRYAPAARHDEVGGDWYDAFVHPGGATVLVIGDVTGHDMEAAATMGQLRNLVRATAYDREGPPSSVLQRVDRMMDGLGIATLATAVVARVEQTAADRARGRRRLRWSNAGHLPPVLRRADGTVEVLATEPDALLGLCVPAERTDHVVVLRPGDTVLLFTDGLVERRDASLTERIAELAAVVGRRAPGLPAEPLPDLCDRVLAQMLPEGGEDDVALLAVRSAPEPPP